MKKATIIDDVIEIRFSFDWKTLEIVKTLPKRRFHDDSNGKYWTCPNTNNALETLQRAGFEIDYNAGVDASPSFPGVAATACLLPSVTAKTADLKKDLYPFQQEGVAHIEARNGRALLADDMGLGKTIQALAWLHLHPEWRPAVVVCPAHIKLNWAHEIKETLPKKQEIQVLFGTDHSSPITGDIIIVNYDILHNKYEPYRDSAGRKRHRELKKTGWIDYILERKPKALIIDEVHYAKSNSAFRSKSVKKMARKIPHVLALSGTPLVNRPIEGFNIIQIVDKTVFPNFWNYVHRYCDAKHTGFGWDFSGATNKDELYDLLTSTVMIRRKKSDVLSELPEKTYSYVPMEMTKRIKDEYTEAEKDFIRFVKASKGFSAAKRAKNAEHLTKIEALKQIAVKGKMDHVIRWIRDFLESGDGDHKLVLFAIHKSAINAIFEEFKEMAVKVDGSVGSTKRDEAVKRFQEDESIKLFIGQLQAAGTGLTLTAASSVAFVELPWTSGELTQAEDRCHRIGQKDAVNIYYLLADGTIEQEIAALLDKKKEVLDAVLDGGEMKEVKLLADLMKKYEEEG